MLSPNPAGFMLVGAMNACQYYIQPIMLSLRMRTRMPGGVGAGREPPGYPIGWLMLV
jgi:hypothetical protein